MTSDDEKLIAVMKKIYAGTKAELLDWEPGEDPNLLAVKLADYTVSIERARETEKTPESFNIAITNGEGLVIEELDSYVASKSGFADMKDLFHRARRHALDIGGALDDLIRELDELSGQKP